MIVCPELSEAQQNVRLAIRSLVWFDGKFLSRWLKEVNNDTVGI